MAIEQLTTLNKYDNKLLKGFNNESHQMLTSED